MWISKQPVAKLSTCMHIDYVFSFMFSQSIPFLAACQVHNFKNYNYILYIWGIKFSIIHLNDSWHFISCWNLFYAWLQMFSKPNVSVKASVYLWVWFISLWIPWIQINAVIGEEMLCQCEKHNTHDPYTVCDKRPHGCRLSAKEVLSYLPFMKWFYHMQGKGYGK